jgi:hypothetical protein
MRELFYTIKKHSVSEDSNILANNSNIFTESPKAAC